MKNDTKTLLIIASLSLLSAVGFLLVVFSCMIWKNWWPLIIFFFWALVSMPLMICIPPRSRWDGLDEVARNCMDLGFFFIGATIFSGVASPVFMAHWRTIEVGAAAMSFAGGIFFCMALLIFVRYSQITQDSNPWD